MAREVTYLSERCKPELSQCLAPCEEGDANACYAAALRIQETGGSEDESEALFQRSCSQGIASACTNRAAGIMKLEEHRPGAVECATRTFEAMCQRADPWACTMFAFDLATGVGVRRDVERALEVLSGGCRFGPDDPACKHALELRRQIDQARSRPTEPR
jgi:TPR repeat protein